MSEGADAGVEVAVRVDQGYCIYAGCFPINVIPPPLSIVFDYALTGAASRVPAIGAATSDQSGSLGRGGLGLTRKPKFNVPGMPTTKFNTASAWLMSDGLGAPFAVGQAADKWFEAATHLGDARMELEELGRSLSADQWSGDDREAFNKEVGELAKQIGDAEMFATIVAWSLVAGVVPLGAWPLGCTIVGVIQFANASLFYAAVASIVGNLGPSEALYASGVATSVTCNRGLFIGQKALTALMATAAIGIVGGAIVQASDQQEHGDEDAQADLQRAVVEMAIEQGVENLAASGIDALTPRPLDVAHGVANPEEYLGKNNDPLQEAVDDHVGPYAEDAGNRGGEEVVGENEPDRGPFSAG